MYDCSKDVLAYHDDLVTLPDPDRTAMRNRRNANRDRAKNGLKKQDKPTPIGFRSQGSYAMRTMVQEPDKDYDIDDGCYFRKEDLVGPKGAELSALQVRQMVRDTVDDGSFKTPPEVKKNCVRVHYEGGYHVDIPCYREVRTEDWRGREEVYWELASSDWKRSDPVAVTQWFEDENKKQSPDETNGRQLRRVVRMVKKFARSRASWKSRIASGFMITKLVAERCHANAAREDAALRYTMTAIRDRLRGNLVIKHPVLDQDLTKGSEDSRAKFLLEKLEEALKHLEVLDKADGTEEEALGAWDKVFATDFFSKRATSKDSAKSGSGPVSAGILIGGGSREPRETHKDGGGRYG